MRRPPRWLTATLRLLCVAVGVVLILSPFSSSAALAAMVTLGLTLTGLLELSRAGSHARLPVAAGIGWLAGAVVVLIWPEATIRVVAVAVGVSLIVVGAIHAVAVLGAGAASGRRAALGRLGARRTSVLVPAMVSIVCGIVAVSWPGVTVLVAAALLGIPVVLFGVDAVIAAYAGSPAEGGDRRRTAIRAWSAAVALVVAAVPLAVSAGTHAAAVRPDAFYTPPPAAPAAPGVLLRSEPFSRGAPAGARAWRILYTTTRDDHTPAVASALVLAGDHLPAGPRPVLAWAHGATGIARQCAPSLLDDPLGGGAMPGLDQLLAGGWVVVATDYIGLGTPGPHPFLIGQGEARSVLDAVRAARHLTAISVAARTVVWGHSQGGNAALWTGILAHTYAPDVDVVGVAALAPGSELTTLAQNWGNGGGLLSGAYLMQAYSDTYPDVRFNTYVRPTARIQIHELASRCLSDSKFYLTGVSSLLFGESMWANDPTTGAFGRRLAENTPSGPIPMPVLIAQGQLDTVVTPTAQDEFVRARCSAGGAVDYRMFPDRDHVSLIAADSPLVPELLRWTQDRLAGKPGGSTCPA